MHYFGVRFFILLLIIGLFFPYTGCQHAKLIPGELILATDKAPKSLDPRIGNDGVSARLHQLIFNTLVNKNEHLEIIPELATFEISSDGKIFTFHLKPGVTFHNGQPLTSEDVKYTFDTLREKSFISPKKGDFAKVENIEAVNSNTVIFHCSSSNLPMLVSMVAIGIISKDSGSIASTKPIGTGPFKVIDYKEDQDLTLQANRSYFEGAPKLEKLKIRFIPDASVRELELRHGGVQMAINPDLPTDTLQKLGQATSLKLWQGKGTNIAYLGLNCEDSILKNVKVRQALSLAIDRESIIKNVYRGMARPAYGPLPPEQWAYAEDLPQVRCDVTQAQKLLDEAGYPQLNNGVRFKLEIKISASALSRQIATVLQEKLRQIGIQLEIKSFEFQTFLSDVISGNYQMYYLINVGANQHPDYLSYTFESSRIPTKANGFSEGANRSRYRNAEVDDLLRQVAVIQDVVEQKRLYGLIQKKVAEEVPQIFLWYPDNVAITSNMIENVQLDLSGSYAFIRNISSTK